jgi:hypothetical protein
MTSASPVERIVSLLTAADFRQLGGPIIVAGVKFEFDAVLLGTESTPDVVVVMDTTAEKDDRLRTKIEGIARALDVVRSRRPLTAILAGPRPTTATLDAISRFCRVLPVGTLTAGNEDQALKDWLAILMPLTLPQASSAVADPMGELLNAADTSNPVLKDLLLAAPRGAEEVRKEFHKLVKQALDAADLDES